MKFRLLHSLIPLLAAALMTGCSTQGPDVVDPASGSRNQLALIAIEGDNGGELVRYNRNRGVENPTEYTSANGASLGMSVDGIYESAYDRIYLHHRAEGIMTVLDVRTRKKVAEIAGFFPSADSGLNGMAFSNLSQGWVIAYGTRKLYHVDAVTLGVVERQTVTLPGNPTSVATSGTDVFVGMQMDDGSGQVAILRSNSGGIFTIERTLDFPTPVIYMVADPDGANMIMISSGRPGADPTGASPAIKPAIHAIRLGSYEVDYQRNVEGSSLHRRIGQAATFAGLSKEAFLYLGFDDKVMRLDVRAGGQGDDYYYGPSGPIGVDYFADYVYIFNTAEKALVPINNEAQELDHVAIPGVVNAIHFITPSKVQ